MKCGASQIKITPAVGSDLSGFAARLQPSIGVLDDLYLRGLYLEAGDEKLLWLHADLIGFERTHVLRVRRTLAAELGLAERQILMSATHTHAGPPTLLLRGCGVMDASYMAALDGYLIQAAHEAVASKAPAIFGYAEGSCGLGCDRRPPSPLSHADPALPVLTFRRSGAEIEGPDGRQAASGGPYIAVVANYAIHNVAMGSDNRHISADMAGAAAGRIRDSLPGSPVVLFTTGGCGNVNPPAESPDRRVTEQFGRRLGDTALYAAKTILREYPGATLASALSTVEAPLNVLSVDEVEASYEHEMAECAAENLFCEHARQAFGEWRAETLALLAAGKPERNAPIEVHAVRIGPVKLAGIGAEVFSQMAVGLRAASGPACYVIGYANGDAGYLPPAAAYDEGGYEVDQAYKFYASTHFMIARGGFELVCERAKEMLAGI